MASLGFDGIEWIDADATRRAGSLRALPRGDVGAAPGADQPGEAGARGAPARARGRGQGLRGHAGRGDHARPRERRLPPLDPGRLGDGAEARPRDQRVLAAVRPARAKAAAGLHLHDRHGAAHRRPARLDRLGGPRGDRGRPQPHPLLPAHARQADRDGRRAGGAAGRRPARLRQRRARLGAPRRAHALALAAARGGGDHPSLGRARSRSPPTSRRRSATSAAAATPSTASAASATASR